VIAEQAEILDAFSCDKSDTLRPLGQGHINATYLVDSNPHPIVLQRLSEDVFPYPAAVIGNFEVIFKYLQGVELSRRRGFVMAQPVYTKNGDLFFKDSKGGYWRGQHYVETTTITKLSSVAQAESVGRALGRFHLLFEKLDLGKIGDPLPGFHHLLLYLKDYDHCVAQLTGETDESIRSCLHTIEKYRERASSIERAREHKELVLQPIHGDPKLDNFIFNQAGEATGLLDLDTVGAGIIYHDLGDCLRSACCTCQESSVDDDEPRFDLNLCEGILEGYFSCGKVTVTHVQPHYIYDGLLAICFELGVRFFTDHLQGNRYFRVAVDGENLQRAQNQLALCRNIVSQESAIRKRMDGAYRT
jgi:Ser/Thr protein kinase RdoA (MazF antagonist)